ncbi:MAG: MG2 domain-containing protein [Proteobacteria bacterium]|nr:MG2 domain-containing protein [Pseudomonadota bacterium]
MQGIIVKRFILLCLVAILASGPLSAAEPDALTSDTAFDSLRAPIAPSLKLLRITPAGDDVAVGQQIVLQFDQAVVPVGQMERSSEAIPVAISPPLNCDWRWLNTSALACQLKNEDKLRLATRYAITVEPRITADSGAKLTELIEHSFTTERPKVTYAQFVTWLNPGTPSLQLTFDQPVTRRSVENSIELATHEGATSIVAFPDERTRRSRQLVVDESVDDSPTVDDRAVQIAEEEARRIWIIEPRETLSLDANVALNVKPGLVSFEGPEKGIEDRTIVSFDTYPEFEFLGIRCTVKGRKYPENIPLDVLKPGPGQPPADTNCVPLSPIALLFTAPVLSSTIKQSLTLTPALNGDRKDYDPWANVHDWSELSSPHRKDRIYQQWLPELLQANQQYEFELDPNHFADEFDRKLTKQIKFNFSTSHREPNLKLSHRFAVLEQGVASDVPLYVTNLKNVDITYATLRTEEKPETGLARQLEVQLVEDISYAMPMGVRQLLGEQSGVVFAALAPDPKPPYWNTDPTILAQVTPYQLHFKVGHFNSLAWVTDLATGLPVESAEITLLKGRINNITALQPIGVSAVTDSNGVAMLAGLEDFDPELQLLYEHDEIGLFAQVRKADALALLPVNYDFAVHGEGVYPSLLRKGGHTRAWGTTAQGIYKLGDQVEFKLYLRDQSNRHWIAPPASSYELSVRDPQGKTIFEKKNIQLNEFGATDGKFKIPTQAAVGWYRFTLRPSSAPGQEPEFSWAPLSILVSDFTPAPFKVHAQLNGEAFTSNDLVTVSSTASLHAGGPFADANIRVSARLNVKSFATDNPIANGFTFGSHSETNSNFEQANLLDLRAALNERGEYATQFALPETDIYYGSLLVESAVTDDRGKFVAASVRADYAGRDRYVGLKNTRWLYEKGQRAELETLVVDQAGRSVSGADVAIAINRREYRAARVKGPGNAYLTQNLLSWEKESSCQVTSRDGIATCAFEPEQPGYYQFVATIVDTQQREHKTSIGAWVTGSGDIVWDQTDDATLQIVAERSDYNVGEMARYLIKNPYPGARALVTVERYGVIDSWIEILESSTPVIEFPVKSDYLPGFYVSVVAVSPRVEKPLGPGKVDLGKPGFRLGYISARVSDPFKKLMLDVKTDRETYKPRERVRASIHVQPVIGTTDEPIEIAVAVVDESVLAMNRGGEDYYDPYRGFNHLDNLDVGNYSLLSRLIGRQKFEKKGANPGGDGGGTITQLRNQFKFVSYWNPSLTPDRQGRATIEFEVPDNLTGWRIFALAVTPNDRMGMGSANIKVNRPTEIRPIMPNQLTEGDQFSAGFSVMNRTPETRNVAITISANGPLAEGQARTRTIDLELRPFKRASVWLPLVTKGSGELRFHAQARDALDGDALTHSIVVGKRRSLETAATYGTTSATEVSESIRIPEGIHADVGELGVILSPSVIGNLDGAFSYIRDYPHQCWEQRLTKAVVASAYRRLNDYLGARVQWPNPHADITAALDSATNFQAPNGGMTYWTASNSHVSPYLSAYTALAFNWLRAAGREIPSDVETRLHDYLLELLKKDDVPSFYTKGMASSVRAVALAALAESGKIDASDIRRYESHVAAMDLFAKAHFLQAALRTAHTDPAIISRSLDVILGHASISGGKIQFNEPWDDNYKYLLATPLRSNCAVLSGLLDAELLPQAKASINDIPFKLVRAVTQTRGDRDHWENTQENVFCLNAMIEYAQRYEAIDPAMKIAVSVDNTLLGKTSFEKLSAASVGLFRPLEKSDIGKTAPLTIRKEGPGRLYYSARLAYELLEDNRERINSGIEIRREYAQEKDGKFVRLNDEMEIRRGDLVRVDLFVSVPSARHFVVINDPVPGGLEIVNSDFSTTSRIDADKGKFVASEDSWFFNFSDWSYYGRFFWSFYHKELRHDSVRFYADYLPAGNYVLSYTAQAIAVGNFTVMPARGEEMYDPDVYGVDLPASLTVIE